MDDDEGFGLLQENHTVAPSPTPKSYLSLWLVAQLPHSVIICIVILFFSSLFELVAIEPTAALFQDSICREYYRLHGPNAIPEGGPVEESMRRIDTVQQELVTIRGFRWHPWYLGNTLRAFKVTGMEYLFKGAPNPSFL
ncbi:hypothetical protein F4806DRAFT_502950 [Annulohypoxylon nitens]|nr:hypothetical protein F4806DRAFT_502950 [Annulohypoxylon nitens]